MEKKRITVSVDEKMLNVVDNIAKSENLNRSEFIRNAISLYLTERTKLNIDELLENGYKEMSAINLNYARIDTCDEILSNYEEQLACIEEEDFW